VQREVLAYLRAQPAEHTVSEWTDDYPASRETVDVTCPWSSFVPLDRIAAAVIGEPVTRAGLESVRRVVKRMAAEGPAELGWWSERVPIGEPRTWTYQGQEHSYQKEGERRRLAARRPLTGAEATAEAAEQVAEQAKWEGQLAHLKAVLATGRG